jgi:hypothetical protein
LEPVLAPGTPEQLHEIRDGRSLAASLTNGGVAKAGDLAKLGWPPNLVSFTVGEGAAKHLNVRNQNWVASAPSPSQR